VIAGWNWYNLFVSTPDAEAFIRFQEENPDYWGDQDENGVDLARLRENLKLTVAERLRRNGLALLTVQQIEQASGRNRTAHRPA
jgi:hypothetical protein